MGSRVCLVVTVVGILVSLTVGVPAHCQGFAGLRGLAGHVVQQGLEGLDVLHRLGQDVHFGHLLDGRRTGHVSLQHLKPVIDTLHSVPLPRVPPGDLHVLRGRDGVAVYWVDGHQFGSGSHFGHVYH